MKTIACRRARLIEDGRNALVGYQGPDPFPLSLIPLFGWTTLAVGAGLFFAGISGPIGAGLMVFSVGSLLIQSVDTSGSNELSMNLGLFGFALLLLAPLTAFSLGTSPKFDKWYSKNYGR